MALTSNQHVLDWVKEMEELMTPDKTIWIDGSEEQLEALRAEACSTGEMIKLNEEKTAGLLPAPHRCERRGPCGRPNALSALRLKKDAGPTNNWMDPEERHTTSCMTLFDGAMKGRTMYVIPYSMGPIGSPFSKVGIELTDSIYVVLNMDIMTRVGEKALDQLGRQQRLRQRPALQSATSTKRNATSCHFPEDNTIMVRQLRLRRKRAAGQEVLRSAYRFLPGQERRLDGRAYADPGHREPAGRDQVYRRCIPLCLRQDQPGHADSARSISRRRATRFGRVGDDIAWMRMGEDGRLWAINPENGFFGVAPGTNEKSNPNALRYHHAGTPSSPTLSTTWTTTPSGGKVWTRIRPRTLIDWKGEPWDGKYLPTAASGAHPNSRFTAPAKNCPCICPRSSTTPTACRFPRSSSAAAVPRPLRWSTSPSTGTHGVFVGSIMASETTAAAAGAVGVVRRDPMAMRPFCGYNMGDYFAALAGDGQEAGRQGAEDLQRQLVPHR